MHIRVCAREKKKEKSIQLCFTLPQTLALSYHFYYRYSHVSLLAHFILCIVSQSVLALSQF
jgi:hypothetical protein